MESGQVQTDTRSSFRPRGQHSLPAPHGDPWLQADREARLHRSLSLAVGCPRRRARSHSELNLLPVHSSVSNEPRSVTVRVQQTHSTAGSTGMSYYKPENKAELEPPAAYALPLWTCSCFLNLS